MNQDIFVEAVNHFSAVFGFTAGLIFFIFVVKSIFSK